MNRNCKKCGAKFKVSNSEVCRFEKLFLKFGDVKISMPLPTFCPDCRNQRRQNFRNDRAFYVRKCDLSGKQFVSMYPSDSKYKVYHPDAWYGDKWNALDYGRDFDFSRPFFEQFVDLMKGVPRLGIDIVNCENSYYCNYCGDDKNCYLDIAGEANEECFYNLFVKYSRNVVDCTFVYNSELCYECINCYECYNAQNCQYCENSSDIFYSFDLKGCKNCIFSSGLRNKQYCIFNKEYSEDEYYKYLDKLALGSYSQRLKLSQGWVKFLRENGIFRSAYMLSCEECFGDNLKNCRNVEQSFNATNCEDCAYLYDVLDAKDCSDLNYSLYQPELSYELISTLSMVRSAFSMASHYSSEVYYCDLTNNSSNLFGCIGLNRAKYCILNKQYSKEEYESLVPEIIRHMEGNGEWGEFFPSVISPFAYNETVVQEYYSLSELEAINSGFTWREDKSESMYKGPDVIVPDNIRDVDGAILKSILKCEQSGKFYKIIPEELKYYRRMNIPLPRVSPDQRHRDRIVLRNPRHLWERTCAKCRGGIKSTFAPERSERVYCESCYAAAIY